MEKLFLDSFKMIMLMVSVFPLLSLGRYQGPGASLSDRISTTAAILVRVDRSGKGDYRKIQDAIDAVPYNNSQHVFILVSSGIYNEKIVVPENKPYVTLSGVTAVSTIITWSDSGSILDSPTFTVFASDFMARFLTIRNAHGSGARAVALRVSGERAAFFGCRILGYQDTLLDEKGRHYFTNCYIEGETDFVCGNAASLFEKSHLHSLAEGKGAITAQRRVAPEEETGFVFVGCRVTGVKSAMLGRPWGAYSRVVFAKSYMSNVIRPAGWDDWGDPSKQRTVYYAEYKCYGGGATTRKRVQWSRSLSDEEAAPFLAGTIIGGKSWIRSVPKRFRRLSRPISPFSTRRQSP